MAGATLSKQCHNKMVGRKQSQEHKRGVRTANMPSHFLHVPSADTKVYSAGADSTLVMHLFKLTLLRLMSDSLCLIGRRSCFRLIIFFWT